MLSIISIYDWLHVIFSRLCSKTGTIIIIIMMISDVYFNLVAICVHVTGMVGDGHVVFRIWAWHNDSDCGVVIFSRC